MMDANELREARTALVDSMTRFARSEIARKLWGDEPPPSDALRSHIHLLRQIVDKPFDRAMIETVHGVGFRLSVPQ